VADKKRKWTLIRRSVNWTANHQEFQCAPTDFVCELYALGHLPWAREVPFQTVHSVSRFFNLSNNLGICSSLEGQPQWLFQVGF
jgi:hypothetical protein